MRSLLVLLLFLTPVLTFAAKAKVTTVTDAPTTLDRGNSHRLFISGFAGQVSVQPSTKPNEITIRATRYVEADDAPTTNSEQISDVLRQIAVKAGHNGTTVEVRTQLPPNRTQWAMWAQGKNMPQVKLDITAPESMNLEIYWARGDVKVNRWKAGVIITHQTGKLSLDDISGDVTVRTMYGATKIENIKGMLNIESFASILNVGQITGKLKLRTFSGETRVRKILGNAIISSQKAPVFTQDTQGSMEIQTGIAAIQIGDHKGSIRGQSDTGSMTAKLLGTIDARFNSNSGPLSISVPRTSHADVALSSSRGELKAPKNLEHKRTSAGKIIRGHLSGNESGVLRINSDSGDVNLKVL
jgi:hypothetical protein